MNILVTGSSGFVGSNVCERLVKLGYTLTGCDNYLFGDPRNDTKAMRHLHVDFNDLSAEQLNEFDLIVQCAVSNIIYAQTRVIETFRNNAINTIKMFQRFKGRILYTSTVSVYGQATVIPTPETAELSTYNAYDSSKLIAELFLQERRNYTTLRLSNVYGYQQRLTTYSGVVSKMICAAMKDKPIDINGDGKSTRDYTFVDDTVDAIVKAVELPALNTEINVGSGVDTSSLGLSEIVCRVLGKPHTVSFIPNRGIDTIYRRCVDRTKAKQLLGWDPKVSLEEGIRRAVEWYKREEERQ
jgi:UDP-glucose 4-epimerase